MSDAAPSNALSGQTSPYLRQHADNPVDWLAWGPDALELAKQQNKPILLSVGYSACHWCHVMAHESFEDDDTAAVMNAHFVNIKVDREERPDIDKIYQAAHQLLTQRPGGWPLTMFLTPDDQAPFFGGTYFPNEPRFGMPSFKDVLQRVVEVYRSKGEEIRAQNTSLVEALRSMEPPPTGDETLSEKPLAQAVKQLKKSFDPRHGGFGEAPKFPHPTNIERLLRHYADSVITGKADTGALHAATFSLNKMTQGGLYDHLGGGFCRYSVDKYWMIPHFEKMLYDNGPLLGLCAEVAQITGQTHFSEVAVDTAQWVMREMQSPAGGYYSTLDADSEGEEGKFYVWERDAVRSALDDDQFSVTARVYGLDREPNFEGRHWHLHTFETLDSVSSELNITHDKARALLDSSRKTLFELREPRIRPGLDDKILTSWNALMIKGMATAGRVLERPDMIKSAENALGFVRTTLWQNSRLLATAKDNYAHLNAYLDDYALLIEALLSLLECRYSGDDIEFAVALADTLLEQFEDRESGGFFFTSNDHEQLLHRPKPTIDDALPAGNGSTAVALLRLGHLLGEPRYLEAAERAVRAAWPSVSAYPHAHNAMLVALEEYLNPTETIVLRGEGEELARWQRRCQLHYAPRRLCIAVPLQETTLPGMLATREASAMTAYVCRGHQCDAPVHDFATLENALSATELTGNHTSVLAS